MSDSIIRKIALVLASVVIVILLTFKPEEELSDEITYDCSMPNLPTLVEKACKRKNPAVEDIEDKNFDKT